MESLLDKSLKENNALLGQQLTAIIEGALKPGAAAATPGVATAVADKPAPVADQHQDGLSMDALSKMFGKGLVVTEAGKPATLEDFGKALTSGSFGETAGMGQVSISRFISQIDGAAGQGLNLGSVAVGGFAGLLLAEVVDGFVDPLNDEGKTNIANVAVKGGVAWAAVQFLPRFTGKMPAVITAAVLIISAGRSILPIDEWIQKIMDFFKGDTPNQQTAVNAQDQARELQRALDAAFETAQARSPHMATGGLPLLVKWLRAAAGRASTCWPGSLDRRHLSED